MIRGRLPRTRAADFLELVQMVLREPIDEKLIRALDDQFAVADSRRAAWVRTTS